MNFICFYAGKNHRQLVIETIIYTIWREGTPNDKYVYQTLNIIKTNIENRFNYWVYIFIKKSSVFIKLMYGHSLW